MKLFKKISHQFFPQLAKIEQARERQSYIISRSGLFFSSFWLSETDQELKNNAKAFTYFTNDLTEEEKIKYKHLLLKVEGNLKYAETLIDSPKESALSLDKYLNSFIEDMKDLNVSQKILLGSLAESSYRCAIYSIISVLQDKLSPYEKTEQLALQQGRLNIAIQNESTSQKETNYWYALHWFIKGNEDNAKFFLKNLFKEDVTIQRVSWLLDDSQNWLKSKIPQNFHKLVQHTLNESQNTIQNRELPQYKKAKI